MWRSYLLQMTKMYTYICYVDGTLMTEKHSCITYLYSKKYFQRKLLNTQGYSSFNGATTTIRLKTYEKTPVVHKISIQCGDVGWIYLDWYGYISRHFISFYCVIPLINCKAHIRLSWQCTLLKSGSGAHWMVLVQSSIRLREYQAGVD